MKKSQLQSWQVRYIVARLKLIGAKIKTNTTFYKTIIDADGIELFHAQHSKRNLWMSWVHPLIVDKIKPISI